ncbi:hypothetical protein XENOCAPTIV_007853 [Xenoophorus captivus]|uniref:Uncharacterized protein n=1 Tax=Xenoophorus captivus TaxID=1517983 RepID=A0ABV0Q9M5_9TELE
MKRGRRIVLCRETASPPTPRCWMALTGPVLVFQYKAAQSPSKSSPEPEILTCFRLWIRYQLLILHEVAGTPQDPLTSKQFFSVCNCAVLCLSRGRTDPHCLLQVRETTQPDTYTQLTDSPFHSEPFIFSQQISRLRTPTQGAGPPVVQPVCGLRASYTASVRGTRKEKVCVLRFAFTCTSAECDCSLSALQETLLLRLLTPRRRLL